MLDRDRQTSQRDKQPDSDNQPIETVQMYIWNANDT